MMLKGLPASGKSTWAIDQVMQSKGKIKRINKDDLRSMLDAGEWSKENEAFIVWARDTLVEIALSEGYSVIVDDTNFNPEHEQTLRQLANYQANFEVKHFDTPLEVCIERDALRHKPVGRAVIEDMYNKYVKNTL